MGGAVGGACEIARGPFRRCLVTGKVLPKAALLRFVGEADGRVAFDPEGRRPGRGLWLSPGRDMIKAACARNLFGRAARRRLVSLDERAADELASEVGEALRRRCGDWIGIAVRLGQAATDDAEIAALRADGNTGLVLRQAGFAEARGAVAEAEPIEVEVAGLDLGRATGRAGVGRIALVRGRIADRLGEEIGRLAGFSAEGQRPGGRVGTE